LIDRLVNEVHWPFFADLFLGLLLLWAMQKMLLHSSLGQILKAIATEFKGLLRLNKFGRSAVNALTISALFAALVLYLFFYPFRELMHLIASMSDTYGQLGDAYVFLTAFFLICVVGLLSVVAIKS
jgi:hypothetical protein